MKIYYRTCLKLRTAVLCLLIEGLLAGRIFAADETASAKLYTLNEILERWKPQPMEQTVAAAEKGDATAQHFLGYYHTEGLGGKTNYVEGRKWYQLAAEQKFPNALGDLGAIYLDGRGVAEDQPKARPYLQQAAELGVPTAQFNLSRLILYGEGKVGLDRQTEGFSWLRKAADAGLAQAQTLYGWLLLHPPAGGRGNAEECISYLKKALAQGHYAAARWLGDVYFDRNYSGRDPATAVKYYLMGAEKNDPACQAVLGWVYFHGLGVEQNLAKAMEWAQKAADQKYAAGWYYLGMIYAGEDLKKKPPGFRPDYEKAAEYYEQAAEAGEGAAAYNLANIIMAGCIPWKEKADAVPLLVRAAKDGHHPSRQLLESIQIDLAANTKGETKLLEEFTISGNTDALSRLASNYRDGLGKKADPVRTFRYEAALRMTSTVSISSILEQMKGRTGNYTKSGDGWGSRVVSQREASFAPVYQALEQALRRNDTAHFKLLAKRYLDGGEMPKDIAEATIWLHFAADLGDTSAREQVAVLDAQLAEEQRRMVQFWVRSLKAYQDSIR